MTTNNLPPFPIPTTFKSRANYKWVERKIPEYSDGEQRTWPGSTYQPSDEEYYLCHLGQKWAERDGIAQPGVNYYIDKLPEGYAMFEINQPNGPQKYKRLFGHPSGRFYDSAMRFEIHFLWLMSGMDGDCECVHCAKKSAASKPIIPRQRKPRDTADLSLLDNVRGRTEKIADHEEALETSGSRGLAVRRTQRQVRRPGGPYAQDEEGSEDIYKDCVKKLELTQGGKTGIEIDLTEENSIDWRTERESLSRYFTQIERQHSFVPRVGELVLWCPNFLEDHHLVLDSRTSEHKFYSFKDKRFHGFPFWRGGVVAAVPSNVVKNGFVDFPDILLSPPSKTTLSTAGFRIESMPDPNDDLDKSMSKQYKHVPLQSIRPLSQWQNLLKGIPEKDLHPSILHALTCMTSISLLEKWRFNGDWPHGRVFCKGIYLGSELITVGDTVRLLTEGDAHNTTTCTDVLLVDSIRYNLGDITSEHTTPVSPYLSGTSNITFTGQLYTIDARRAFGSSFNVEDSEAKQPPPLPHEEVKILFRAVGADEYGPWYSLHGPRQKYEFSYEHVLGRLYEADAVRLWTGQRQHKVKPGERRKPDLDFDADSVLAGRRYGSLTDARLPDLQPGAEISWFIADTRAEALGIATLNGIDVGRYHEARDEATLRRWRAQLKIADGRDIGPELEKEVTAGSHQQQQSGARRGRPPGSKVIDGRLVLAGEYMASDAEDEEPMDKPKSSSQMAGAALASDSEGYDDDGDHHEYDEYDEADEESADAQDLLEQFTGGPDSRKRETLTKQNIMSSVELTDGIAAYDDDEDDDYTWVNEVRPLRGGTEETEGGDYRD